MYLIYCITNKITTQIYIGKTVRSLNKRKTEHLHAMKKGYSNHLYNAMRKYGWENFSWRAIDTCETKKDLLDLESVYIDMFGSFFKGLGYNMTQGGDGGFQYLKAENHPWFGRHHTEESKRKIAEAQKGPKAYNWRKHLSEDHKQRLKESRVGSTHSIETKSKMSRSRLGKYKGKDNPAAKSIRCIETQEVFSTVRDAANKYALWDSNLAKCCRGKIQTTGGRHWEYV